MPTDFWQDIDAALEARERARAFDPSAYPLNGSHADCDHAANYCALTLDNYYQ